MTERALSIRLTAELVDAIAGLVLERVRGELLTDAAQSNGHARWLYGDKAAAKHLGWPLGRVQKLSTRRVDPLPCHRDGQRKSYLTTELDDWMRDHGNDE